MEILKGEQREKKEKIFETLITENVLQLMSDTKAQIQETQRTPSRKITRNTTPRLIIYKQQKIKGKGKVLSSERRQSREKHLTCRGGSIRITSKSSSATMQAKRGWSEIFFQMLRN